MYVSESLVDQRTVYYRPPKNYLDPPETLLAVLRKIFVGCDQNSRQAMAGSA